MLCFLQVPLDNQPWQVFLRAIMDLVFSPTITTDATYILSGMIEDHHSLFLEVTDMSGENIYENITYNYTVTFE